jgi:hypothetical protein
MRYASRSAFFVSFVIAFMRASRVFACFSRLFEQPDEQTFLPQH